MSIFTAYPKFRWSSNYLQNLFSLETQSLEEQTIITMIFRTTAMNTTAFPDTHRLLQKHLPTILQSKCFNDAGLPFSKEVRKTEIGHLFEHILLEYLCELKLEEGYEEAVYAGKTSWNWHKEPYGTFNITINVGFDDIDILPDALAKSIKLLKRILEHQSMDPYLLSQSTLPLYQ